MKLYSAVFKCNKTGRRIENAQFMGEDEKDALSVIKEYCQSEDRTLLSDLSIVNNDFVLNPVEINKALVLVSEDVEEDFNEFMDYVADCRMNTEAAND